jgi:hypothetical protein
MITVSKQEIHEYVKAHRPKNKPVDPEKTDQSARPSFYLSIQ